MKTVLAIAAALILASCTASYDSPRTGIKYRIEVPFSAVAPYLPVVSPQK